MLEFLCSLLLCLFLPLFIFFVLLDVTGGWSFFFFISLHFCRGLLALKKVKAFFILFNNICIQAVGFFLFFRKWFLFLLFNCNPYNQGFCSGGDCIHWFLLGFFFFILFLRNVHLLSVIPICIVINDGNYGLWLMQLLSERLYVTLYLAIFINVFNFCISFFFLVCNICVAVSSRNGMWRQ